MQIKRDVLEYKDALKTLNISATKSTKTNWAVNIFLWAKHQESLTLAAALYNRINEFKKKVNIILADLDNRGMFIFNWKWFELCAYPDIFDFAIYHWQMPANINWDADGFKKYTNNKMLASVILKMNWIDVPDEIVFRERHNKSWKSSELMRYFQNLKNSDKRYVLKPVDENCWKWVKILTQTELEASSFYDENIAWKKTMLVQEKVDSFPIYIDWVRKDWNLRTLVTYDLESEKYKTVWVIGRIDNDGWPVNVSITADYISFEEISKLAWWSEEKSNEILKVVFEIASKSVDVIKNRITKDKNIFTMQVDQQVLSWVDVIISRECRPFVIEVNNANSCGVYQLMKFKWLYPIADSILTKAIISKDMFDAYNKNKAKKKDKDINIK